MILINSAAYARRQRDILDHALFSVWLDGSGVVDTCTSPPATITTSSFVMDSKDNRERRKSLLG